MRFVQVLAGLSRMKLLPADSSMTLISDRRRTQAGKAHGPVSSLADCEVPSKRPWWLTALRVLFIQNGKLTVFLTNVTIPSDPKC